MRSKKSSNKSKSENQTSKKKKIKKLSKKIQKLKSGGYCGVGNCGHNCNCGSLKPTHDAG